jgi:hypothetical protein
LFCHFIFTFFIIHGSLIFWLNPLAKPNAIAEYSPFSHEAEWLVRWLSKELANGGFITHGSLIFGRDFHICGAH